MMHLAEYQKRPSRLADYLPWACLIATGVVLNKDGSFQRTAAFRGPDLESSTPEELIAICARINNALKRFGSGWALFFEAARNPAMDYPCGSAMWPPAAWLIESERRGLFEESGDLFESAYYLTFARLPPEDSTRKMESLLIETPEEADDSYGNDHLARFIAETDKALDLFAAILPHAEFLNDNDTLTYLRSSVSPRRHPVHAPETPAYLDAILGGSTLIGGLEPVLDDQHIRIVSVQGFPNTTEPGLLDELNSLGFSYRWMTRFLPMDKAEATKTLGRYRRQWFSKRKSILSVLKEVMTNEASALVDTDADNQAVDADTALQTLGADHVAFGYATTAIAVHHRDPLTADEMIKSVERIVNGRGYVTIRESVNAVDAWLGMVPGHAYANIRQPIIHTLNLAHMMPLSAVWAGPTRNTHLDGPPLLYATTGTHTPFRLVTHQGDVGHTIIVGPTGAGKSVLLSMMAAQFRRYSEAQVFIFDKGSSAKLMTAAMWGDHYQLGGDDALCFQPLARIDEAQERTWAQDWIADLLVHEGIEVTPEVKETVWTALTSLSSAPKAERTLTGLSALLQSSRLRQALLPYTLDGAHGAILDADNESLGESHWQCFEMEELMHSKALVLPVLTYIFHRLEERFDGKPSMLILDEAWVFLDDPLFATRIREWLKVLRKKNVSVIFATQSLSDIAGSSIAPAIIESCPSRIFLPNDRALEPQQRETYAQFGLNARQIEIIAQATPKQDYYFQSRSGNRLFDLALGPVALAFSASSSKDDLKAMRAIWTDTPGEDFAPAWLHHKDLPWAADMIDPGLVLDRFDKTSPPSEGDMPCAAE